MAELGDKVKDKVTGLEGIVVALSQFLYGCRRVGVQPVELKDGKPVEPSWFDEPQVEILEAGHYQIKPKVDKEPGGPTHLIPPAKKTG